MDMQPVRLGSKTIFSQNAPKFGLGDRKNVYEKRGLNPIFYQNPPKFGFVDGKMEKKCMKRKGNNVGSCPFLPIAAKIWIWGWENVKNIYMKSVKSKYSFEQVFLSIITSLVYYHQISLAYAMPKHTSCHKRICSRLGSKTIFPKMS